MFQIFLTAAYISSQDPGLMQLAQAEKQPQTLEEINAELLKKKAELEPFDEKKVKVDVESLGLDDLDQKPVEKKPEEKPAESAPPVALPIVDSKSPPAPLPTPPAPEIKIEAASKEADKPANQSDGIVSKIQNLLKKKEEPVQDPAAATPEATQAAASTPAVAAKQNSGKTEKYINSQKKAALKKRLEAEKRRKQYEKQQVDKAKKLKELRDKYLIKIKQDEQGLELTTDEDFEEDGSAIIPHKKSINPFISEELPALPILDRYRTSDNLHIPIVLTPRERIQILFDAIYTGSVSYFNSAYKDIENPNVRNQMGDTLLTYATLLRKHPIIASILTKGGDPMLANGLGYNPMDIAIEMRDFKALELLVENGANVNYTDNFGRTYLMHAARIGFLPAVELLVAKGADVNAMDNDGFTALSIAYRHKKEIIVRFLVKNGAKTWIEKPYDPGEQSLIKELENRWK